MKTCPNCKELNEVDAKFCVKCGTALLACNTTRRNVKITGKLRRGNGNIL